MYKIWQKDPTYIYCIERLSDNAMIPLAPDNTDYQTYLKWLADGNVPLAAETNTPTPADGE
jgi:hypothetical protein